jgi:hypothetical protein
MAAIILCSLMQVMGDDARQSAAPAAAAGDWLAASGVNQISDMGINWRRTRQ